MKVLIGISGSVALIKIPELVKKLKGHDVICVATGSAEKFDSLLDCPVYYDSDEWTNILNPNMTRNSLNPNIDHRNTNWNILHIKLRDWADVFLIAPATANTIAKLANGICDNLLLSIARACTVPIVVCPAMNTAMWNHPLTSKHVQTLVDLNIVIVNPVVKMLACGDFGIGAMAHLDDIIACIGALKIEPKTRNDLLDLELFEERPPQCQVRVFQCLKDAGYVIVHKNSFQVYTKPGQAVEIEHLKLGVRVKLKSSESSSSFFVPVQYEAINVAIETEWTIVENKSTGLYVRRDVFCKRKTTTPVF
jgi:phosphopantothenoylcysteine decarboxylase